MEVFVCFLCYLPVSFCVMKRTIVIIIIILFVCSIYVKGKNQSVIAPRSFTHTCPLIHMTSYLSSYLLLIFRLLASAPMWTSWWAWPLTPASRLGMWAQTSSLIITRSSSPPGHLPSNCCVRWVLLESCGCGAASDVLFSCSGCVAVLMCCCFT